MKCLFCRSTNIANAAYPRPTRFNNKEFSYKICEDCNLVFIDPLPTQDDYDRMYARDYHNEFYFKETVPDYSNWLELFEKYSNEKSVLDYGCGDGSFLKFFHSKGYECTGVEYDPQLVERLRNENPGITFYTVDEFWKLDPAVLFNAIYMGDVLEHLATPADFLDKVIQKLRPGGLITAQGPLENNSHLALGVRKVFSGVKSALSKDAVASHVPYHISFSDVRNQKAVFEQSGFRTEYYKVFEKSWPFPDHFSASPSAAFQFLVARSSIFLSGVLPGKMGNRFMYVGSKK